VENRGGGGSRTRVLQVGRLSQGLLTWCPSH